VLCSFYHDTVRIIPEAKMRELASSLPATTIPRVKDGPLVEWAHACKGGPKAGSNFEYSGPFTEAVLLSNQCRDWFAAPDRVGFGGDDGHQHP
jgi:hypothetical protein